MSMLRHQMGCMLKRLTKRSFKMPLPTQALAFHQWLHSLVVLLPKKLLSTQASTHL